MQYEIRERDLSGVLDEGIKVTKDNFKLLFTINLVLTIPCLIAIQFLDHYFTPVLPPNPTPQDVMVWQQAVFANMKYTLPPTFIYLVLILPIANAAIVRAIADCYLGQPATVGKSYGHAFSRFFPLLWTSFLMGTAIMGGFILCIIPGILASLWFGLATQIVVLEGISGFAALKRSKELMKDNLGNFFILGLVVGAISVGIQLCAKLIPQAYVQGVLVGVLSGVASIVGSAMVVVFYFSCRCKHEQFDLQLLAAGVGAEPPSELTVVPDDEL